MDKKEVKKIFLPHFSDPIRQKIGMNCIRHEFAKLFRSKISKVSYKKIDEAIQDRYKNLSVGSFWNEVHAVTMGFEQTNFVFWATSLNVNWNEKELFVDELWFGKSNEEIGAAETASDVKEKIFLPENKDFFVRSKKELDEQFSKISFEEEFPIFVIKKEGKLRVVDGNRRLLRTIINGKNKIKAIVGEPVDLQNKPIFYEYWVPTPLLVDLVHLYKWQSFNGKKNVIRQFAETISEIIRDTSAGRAEFFENVIHKDDKFHMQLSEAVSRILAEI